MFVLAMVYRLLVRDTPPPSAAWGRPAKAEKAEEVEEKGNNTEEAESAAVSASGVEAGAAYTSERLRM